MDSQAPHNSAIDQIRTRRGWKHRRWRRAMMRLCRQVAREDAHVTRIPRQSALICMRDFERANGLTFDPLDSAHCWKVVMYARYGRIGWAMRRHFGKRGACDG